MTDAMTEAQTNNNRKEDDKNKSGSKSRRKPFDPDLRPDPYDYGPGDSSPYPLTASDLDCS